MANIKACVIIRFFDIKLFAGLFEDFLLILIRPDLADLFSEGVRFKVQRFSY